MSTGAPPNPRRRVATPRRMAGQGVVQDARGRGRGAYRPLQWAPAAGGTSGPGVGRQHGDQLVIAGGTIGRLPERKPCCVEIGHASFLSRSLKIPAGTSHPGNIQPGDLVFFRIGGKEQHAGIYMGGDRFIHASTSVGVTQSSMTGYYWKGRFTQARRFD